MVAGAVYAFINIQIILGILLAVLVCVLSAGILIVQPNQSKVLTFFGRYIGCVKESGIWFVVPFALHKKVSLRVRNFNSKTLKVNDVEGNPVEIAAVVVFKVVDSARAVFDVEDYEKFVEIQSETALRHVATRYPYDTFEEGGYSLRGNADEVAGELARELQERLQVAGVEVLEARLTHLAYATEIASAMLQRQQATAILAARQKIVEGAVGMAQMAIAKLEEEGVVELDEERKVAMINNLMVAIVSDRAAQPVINAGSLY
ncbi:SPFH domain-containing protein [Candidatus Formimonas warabiya]